MNTNPSQSGHLNQKIINLLLDLKYRDRFSIRLLSKNYPLSGQQLEFYKDLWMWNEIPYNQHIQMDEELIKTFEDKWDWRSIPRIEQNFSDSFLDKYCDRLSWYELSSNAGMDFPPQRIEKYKDKIDWSQLLKNKNLKITEELLSNYEDRIEWRNLSFSHNIVFTESLLERFADKWDWAYVSKNPKLNINLQLLEKFGKYLTISGICENYNISNVEKILQKYKERLDWTLLSSNSALPLSKEFILKYEEFWDWSELSRNYSLPVSIGFLDTFSDKLDWDALSVNHLILENEDIIRHYKDRWNWYRISYYNKLELTEEFIEEFADYWDWNAISANPSFPVSDRILDKYLSKLGNYYGLSANNNTVALLNYMERNGTLPILKWDIVSKSASVDLDLKTFLRYEKFWDYEKVIYNQKLCSTIIKDSINDLVVFEVMEDYLDAKSRRYPKAYKLIGIQREIACIELAKSFVNREVVQNEEYYAKLAIENQNQEYDLPENKSFVELWDMHGFKGSGIGNQNGSFLKYADMEECIYRWFEILYDRSTAELDKVEENSIIARGIDIENFRKQGIRINFGPAIFHLPGDIQKEFGNY